MKEYIKSILISTVYAFIFAFGLFLFSLFTHITYLNYPIVIMCISFSSIILSCISIIGIIFLLKPISEKMNFKKYILFYVFQIVIYSLFFITGYLQILDYSFVTNLSHLNSFIFSFIIFRVLNSLNNIKLFIKDCNKINV
jgi:hypothetical protein